MRGGVGKYQEVEQRLREYVTLRKAQYALKAKVEKQRWEQDVLVPEIKCIEQRLLAGESFELELPEINTPAELTAGD